MDRHAPAELVRRLDHEQAYPYELYDAWVEAGLLGLPFPEEYGGLGGSVIDLPIVAEEIARTSADFFMAFAGSMFCGLNILRKGIAGAEETLAAPAPAGEKRMSISISEPDAGSDVGAHAHQRAARRRRLDHQRPEAVGDRRGRARMPSSTST